MHLDTYGTDQINTFVCLPLHEIPKRRNLCEQCLDVAEDHPGLRPVTCHDHDHAALAWLQIRAPVSETGEEDGH